MTGSTPDIHTRYVPMIIVGSKARDRRRDYSLARVRAATTRMRELDRSDPSAWETEMSKIIRNEVSRQYLYARGGPEQMTETDWTRLDDIVQDQLGYLKGFARQLPNLTDGQVNARVAMYARSAQEAYFRAQAAANGLPDLPANPGDGKTICLTNCRCRWVLKQEGDTWYAWWKLGLAEHCFPAGTQVSTPTGSRDIESIRLGDLVSTRFGPRRVTKLYRSEHAGQLVQVTAGHQTVWCTPNHPFYTQRGWVSAEALSSTNDSVLLENGYYPVSTKIGLPNTNNSISTLGQVSVSGSITSLLADLPLSQGVESGMAVPPIAIHLDNEHANQGINDEFRLYQSVRLIDDIKAVEYCKQPRLKLGWLIFLQPLVPFHKLLHNIWPAKVLLPEPFLSSRLLRRIMCSHVLSGLVMHLKSIAVKLHAYSKFICLIDDALSANAKMRGAVVRPLGRIKIPHELLGLRRPMKSNAAMGRAKIVFPVSGKTADWTYVPCQSFCGKLRRSAGFTEFSLSPANLAANGTSALLISSFTRPRFGMRSHLLPPSNVQCELYSTDGNSSNIWVYNLEVEGEHEYIANGFVVHNCDDCVENSRRWNPLVLNRLGQWATPGEFIEEEERPEPAAPEAPEIAPDKGPFEPQPEVVIRQQVEPMPTRLPPRSLEPEPEPLPPLELVKPPEYVPHPSQPPGEPRFGPGRESKWPAWIDKLREDREPYKGEVITPQPEVAPWLPDASKQEIIDYFKNHLGATDVRVHRVKPGEWGSDIHVYFHTLDPKLSPDGRNAIDTNAIPWTSLGLDIFERAISSGEIAPGYFAFRLMPKTRKGLKGGRGSGYFSPYHHGRPGKVGGSMPMSGARRVPKDRTSYDSTWERATSDERRARWERLRPEERDDVADAPKSIVRAVERHIGRPQKDTTGVIRHARTRVAESAHKRLRGYVGRTSLVLQAAGSKPQDAERLTKAIAEHLVAQEVEASGRTLGDHGIAHAAGNARMAEQILMARSGSVSSQERAELMIAAALHDTGYLTRPAQVFLDNDHRRWSVQHYEANVRPLVKKALGDDAAERIARMISYHDSDVIDWEREPQASALRVADNLSLFRKEKLPALFRYLPGNLSVLMALGRGSIDVGAAKAQMKANVTASKYPPVVKARLLAAVNELGKLTPKFTLGMLGGRIEGFDWKNGHLVVKLRRNRVADRLQKQLELGQAQFTKLAKSYGVDPKKFARTDRFDLQVDGETIMQVLTLDTGEKGGAGSGNFGHAGRPGKRGGSAPGKGHAVALNPARTEQAISHFGLTSNSHEAGYILPDGSMLDFSGSRRGERGGRRYIDHNRVYELYSDEEMAAFEEAGEQTGPWETIARFMNETGAIRWHHGADDYVQITVSQRHKITDAQRDAMDEALANSPSANGHFDIWNDNAKSVIPPMSFYRLDSRSLRTIQRTTMRPRSQKGGRGSGNFGHAGRPGKRGGSASTAYYHLTSPEAAESIQREGFRPSATGELGPGIYLTQTPEQLTAPRYAKASRIIVRLREGARLLEVKDGVNRITAILRALNPSQSIDQAYEAMKPSERFTGGDYNWGYLHSLVKRSGYAGMTFRGHASPKNTVVFDQRDLVIEAVKGGQGSGNFQHAGRPGKRGGSAPRAGHGMADAYVVKSPRGNVYYAAPGQTLPREVCDGSLGTTLYLAGRFGVMAGSDSIGRHRDIVNAYTTDEATREDFFNSVHLYRFYTDPITVHSSFAIPRDELIKIQRSSYDQDVIERRLDTTANKTIRQAASALMRAGLSPDTPFIWRRADRTEIKGTLADFDANKVGRKGGTGSGNFGHAGRPGKRGGSAPRGGHATVIGKMDFLGAVHVLNPGERFDESLKESPKDTKVLMIVGQKTVFADNQSWGMGGGVEHDEMAAFAGIRGREFDKYVRFRGLREGLHFDLKTFASYCGVGELFRKDDYTLLELEDAAFKNLRSAVYKLHEAGASLDSTITFFGFENRTTEFTIDDVVNRGLKGGAGSGNFGHAGRPGKRGGSAPRAGHAVASIPVTFEWRREDEKTDDLYDVVRTFEHERGRQMAKDALRSYNYNLRHQRSLLVARDGNGKAVGVAAMRKDSHSEGAGGERAVYITFFGVDRPRSGVGAQMMRTVAEYAYSIKQGVCLTAGDDSPEFYQKIGMRKFARDGQFYWTYGDCERIANGLRVAAKAEATASVLILANPTEAELAELALLEPESGVFAVDQVEAVKGGAGSGNFGHAGRPGKRGGSAPSQGHALTGYGFVWDAGEDGEDRKYGVWGLRPGERLDAVIKSPKGAITLLVTPKETIVTEADVDHPIVSAKAQIRGEAFDSAVRLRGKRVGNRLEVYTNSMTAGVNHELWYNSALDRESDELAQTNLIRTAKRLVSHGIDPESVMTLHGKRRWVEQSLSDWIEYGRYSKGGPGSGFFGHAGRPGKRGGSAPSLGHGNRVPRQQVLTPEGERKVRAIAREWLDDYREHAGVFDRNGDLVKDSSGQPLHAVGTSDRVVSYFEKDKVRDQVWVHTHPRDVHPTDSSDAGGDIWSVTDIGQLMASNAREEWVVTPLRTLRIQRPAGATEWPKDEMKKLILEGMQQYVLESHRRMPELTQEVFDDEALASNRAKAFLHTILNHVMTNIGGAYWAEPNLANAYPEAGELMRPVRRTAYQPRRMPLPFGQSQWAQALPIRTVKPSRRQTPKQAGQMTFEFKGGAGSGNFGHAGRPGKRGGSAPRAGHGIVGYHATRSKPFDVRRARVRSQSYDMGGGFFGSGPKKVERHGFFLTDNREFAKVYGDHIMRVVARPKKTAKVSVYDNPELIEAFDAELQRQGIEGYQGLALDLRNNLMAHWELFNDEIGRAFTQFLAKQGYDSAEFDEETPKKNPDGTANDEWVQSKTFVALTPKILRLAKRGNTPSREQLENAPRQMELFALSDIPKQPRPKPSKRPRREPIWDTRDPRYFVQYGLDDAAPDRESRLSWHDYKGGPGSGFFGHAGRPGKSGGSAPKAGHAVVADMPAGLADYLASTLQAEVHTIKRGEHLPDKLLKSSYAGAVFMVHPNRDMLVADNQDVEHSLMAQHGGWSTQEFDQATRFRGEIQRGRARLWTNTAFAGVPPELDDARSDRMAERNIQRSVYRLIDAGVSPDSILHWETYSWGERTSRLSHWLRGTKGGPGSGFYGHAGRPGKRGGSAPRAGHALPAGGKRIFRVETADDLANAFEKPSGEFALILDRETIIVGDGDIAHGEIHQALRVPDDQWDYCARFYGKQVNRRIVKIGFNSESAGVGPSWALWDENKLDRVAEGRAARAITTLATRGFIDDETDVVWMPSGYNSIPMYGKVRDWRRGGKARSALVPVKAEESLT